MSRKKPLSKLFEPGRIGSIVTRNRIVMAPMASACVATDDGAVTDRVIDYYEARARGGVGLIVVGSAAVDFPLGISGKPRLSIDDDRFIPGLAQVAQAIHRHGTKAFIQLHHAGPAAPANIIKLQPVAASAVGRPPDYRIPSYALPRELSVSEIAEKVELFARAAGRAVRAGYDGIQLNAAHRYLINSFLSPHYNRRRDSYGGDLNHRARFLLEILAAIRGVVGQDYPICCRINGAERDVADGINAELAAQLARILEKAGVDAIDVSCYNTNSPTYPPGFNVREAALVKKAVSIPVMVVGRIEPGLGEKILRQRKADFIAVSRGLLTDPDMPKKAATGRLDEIVPCLRCNTCLSQPGGLQDLKCVVNPAVTREREYEMRPAEKSRKVLVVGGGPAGLEAARVAALRGHQVSLYDRERRLGGQLRLASILRPENWALVRYLVKQMEKLGVRVELGQEVTPALIDREKPDVVVAATGATSVLPEIPGIERGNVFSGADIQNMRQGRFNGDGVKGSHWQRLILSLGGRLMAVPFGLAAIRWLLRFRTPFGQRVVVVGKGLPGIELAYFLVQLGKQITIVDTREEAPYDEPPMPMLRRHLEEELAKRNVPVITAAKYEQISEHGLIITDKEGQTQNIEGDRIVFTGYSRPDTTLSHTLPERYAVHLIGDCAGPSGILEAIHSGFRVGRAI